MRLRAVIFGAEYFYYPDSNIHQTLILNTSLRELSENVYFCPPPPPTFPFWDSFLNENLLRNDWFVILAFTLSPLIKIYRPPLSRWRMKA